MAGYLLSGSAVKRTARVVKSQSTTPLRGGVQGSRRIGGQGGKVSDDTPSHPWKISLFKKEDDDTQYCKVGSGTINTNITNVVPEGLVNLSSYGDGDTVYIYARIANDWEVGGSLNSRPTLTVLTDENDTNFAGNKVRFPASDLGYYFLPIGKIEVEKIPETSPIEYTYTIEQIETNNISIEQLTLNYFSIYSILNAKTSDTALDSQRTVFVKSGFADLPDSNNTGIDEYSVSVGVDTATYLFLEVTGTQTTRGGWENFTATVINHTSPSKPNTTNTRNIAIGSSTSTGYGSQSMIGGFYSGGTIY